MDNNMTVTTRITTIRLLELMKEQPEYAEQLGLKDVSRYRDESMLTTDNGQKSRRRTK